MKTAAFFQTLDFVGQSLLIFGALSSLLFIPVAPAMIFIYFLGLLFLGGWQLTSALTRFLLAGDLFRGWYFMASITYCGILYGGVYYLAEIIDIPPGIGMSLSIAFFGIIPTIAGGWYYQQTLKDN